MKLTFITGSKSKFDEAKTVIPELEHSDIDLTEIQNLDSMKIINSKIEEARKFVDGNIVVEDASLCLDGVNGLPGPFAKWFLEAIGNEGLYKLVQGMDNLNASTKVVLGLYFNGETKFFEGENGFGFDPIFEVKETGRTFAEMTFEEKRKISMRRIAFQKLKDYLTKQASE